MAAGVLMMLAPMIRLMPQAIEKNAKREEMSRMRGRGIKAHCSMNQGSQAFTRLVES